MLKLTTNNLILPSDLMSEYTFVRTVETLEKKKQQKCTTLLVVTIYAMH